MRIGRVLVTAGMVLSLGAGAMGAGTVNGTSAAADSNITITIIEPLEIQVDDISFGEYLSTTDDIREERAGIRVTGSGSNLVDLSLSTDELDLTSGGDMIKVELALSENEVSVESGEAVSELIANIDASQVLNPGDYSGTVTVTATYQ